MARRRMVCGNYKTPHHRGASGPWLLGLEPHRSRFRAGISTLAAFARLADASTGRDPLRHS